jgi:molybdopterin/thiamine biosynthesis adenylyltransferase
VEEDEAMKRFNCERIYERQLPLIGEDGQERLAQSKVMVFGLGGLGSIVTQYLAAAGVGELVLVDYDSVDINNLNRQILYDYASIGIPKPFLAARRLRMLNPCTSVKPLYTSLSEDTLDTLRGQAETADLLIDALDNWRSRLLLDKLAHTTGKPLVHGAVESYYGQIMAVIPGKTACLRCIAPRDVERKHKIPVIGASVAAIASLEAKLALDILLGKRESAGVLIMIDTKNYEINKIKIEACPCENKLNP